MPASQANSSSIRTGNFARLPRSIPEATATAIEIGWPAVRAGWQFGQATPDRTAHDGIRLYWDPETRRRVPLHQKPAFNALQHPSGDYRTQHIIGGLGRGQSKLAKPMLRVLP